MARDILAVSTSSEGSGNLFSTSCDICHYYRNCLAPETIKEPMTQMCTDCFALSCECECEFLEDEDN